MRTSKKHLEAERQRTQYLTSRNTSAIRAPVEVEIDPLRPSNLMPDIPNGQKGLLSKAELNANGFQFEIDQWYTNELPGQDTLTLYFQNVALEPVIKINRPLAGQFPLKLNIPKNRLGGDGLKKVHYHVVTFTQQYGTATPVEFTVDLYDPNALGTPDAAELPPEIGHVLTGEYLDTHGGVEITIPPYADPWPGDRCEFFWSYFDGQPIQVEDLPGDGQPYTFTIDAAKIRSQPDGERLLTYKLWDRAGNDSKPATVYPLKVISEPEPANLQPPRVPLAPIDLKDAQIGVTVEIDHYDNAIPGLDTIVVNFNGKPLFKPLDRPSFPVSIDVPWEVLKSGGVTGPYQAPVSYKIVRGTDEYFYTPPITVEVDLSTAGGGDDPSGPGPINDDLDPPLVISSTGKDNELGQEDINEDAKVTFALYDDVQLGHQVQVYWGGVEALSPAHTINQDDLDRGHFELTVPWSVIDTVKNGEHEVYYTLNNGLNDNETESPRTLVKVNIFEIGDLADPQFTRFIELAPGQYLINCTNQPYNGVPIRILDRANIEAEDTITIEWRLLQGFSGDTEIGAASGTFLITVKQDHANAGHPGELFTVPYSPYVELGGFESRIRLYYRLEKSDGFNGGTSDIIEAYLLQQELDGGGCRISS